MNHWQGKWALVTGASAGIGTALARELAAGGTNLVLTARRRDRLVGLAGELSAKHNIRTLVCTADLAQPLGPREIFDFTEEKKITVDLLVNNAGFGAYGEFQKTQVERLVEMVQVNVSAVVHLTHLYLPGMIARGSGDILILASTAAFQPVPYITTYAATKSFGVQSKLKRAAQLTAGSDSANLELLRTSGSFTNAFESAQWLSGSEGSVRDLTRAAERADNETCRSP